MQDNAGKARAGGIRNILRRVPRCAGVGFNAKSSLAILVSHPNLSTPATPLDQYYCFSISSVIIYMRDITLKDTVVYLAARLRQFREAKGLSQNAKLVARARKDEGARSAPSFLGALRRLRT